MIKVSNIHYSIQKLLFFSSLPAGQLVRRCYILPAPPGPRSWLPTVPARILKARDI